MKKLEVDDILEIFEKSEKPFNDMVDWHIAFFTEGDDSKQKIYHTVYENKLKQYNELMKKHLNKYE